MLAVCLPALGLLYTALFGTTAGQERGQAIGGVAADHTACSEVGRDILAKGGSAVDSAIATLLCVGVRQPHSMGIGGGVFLVVYDKRTRSVKTYDGREVAPLAATFETYLNRTVFSGKWSIGVPGEIQAYWRAHQEHGRLPWKDLFTPAINMAQNGHPLSYAAAYGLRMQTDVFGVQLGNYPGLCQLFCKKNSMQPKEEGDRVVRPKLALTLRGIAKYGPVYLYSNRSHIARALVKDVQDMGGLLTIEDLETYKVVQDPPVSVAFGDLTLHTLTAPSGGPILALITRILHDLQLRPSALQNVSSEAALWHKVVEVFKFAYADRLHLADPAFVDITKLLQKLASTAHANKIRNAINPTRTYDVEHYTSITSEPVREGGTTHLSILGPEGDAVSASSSINHYFGSLLVSPSTGIILNNQLADFNAAILTPGTDINTLKSSSPNFIHPGKRPLSSMAPCIVVDRAGNPRLVLGSEGGSTITTVVAQVIARVLWLGQTLKEAIEAKRLHHQLIPNELKFEYNYPKEMIKELHKYGHHLLQYVLVDDPQLRDKLLKKTTYMAVVQGVSRDPTTGHITAFSDLRKQGEARLLYPAARSASRRQSV